MNRSAGRKAQLPANGIVQIALISILSFIIFSAQAYGSTDIPVNAAATTVTIGESALFAGFAGQGIITAAYGDTGSTAASTFVTAFHDEEAVYSDIEPLGTTMDTARTSCQDSCSL